MPSESKAKALADLAAGHVAFKEVVRGIPEDRVAVPMHGAWSTKDLTAHISAWNEFVALDMRRLARGHVPCIAAFREEDVDEWNDFLMRGRKLFSPGQVFHELEGCYQMLVEALDAVPERMFEGGGMVTNVLAVAVHHYGDHAGHIRQWRESEGI